MRNRQSRTAKTVLGAAATLAAALLLWWAVDARPRSTGPGGPVGAIAGPAGPNAGAEDAAANRDPLSVARESGFYTAPAGSEFGYRFAAQARSRVEMTLADQPATQQTILRLDGAMTVLVVARRDHELIAQVTFSGLGAHQGVAGSEERSAAIETLLALPVAVHMRDDGDLLGFRFDKQSNGFANNLVRSILCGFRFVVPAGAAAAWQCEEPDPTGIASVGYQWLDAAGAERRLRRTKTAYRAAPGQRSDLEVQYGVDSKALGTLSSELGWLRAAELHETISAKATTANLRTTTGFEASLTLATHTRRSPAELPDAGWGDKWASVQGLDDLRAIAASSEHDLLQLELGDATLEGLLQDILALAAMQPVDSAALTAAAHKLSLLLREHPDELERLAAAMATAPPFAADVLLSAIGAANTPQAQQFLARVAGDATAALHLRQSALDAMIQLTRPEDGVLSSVRALVDDPNGDAGLRNNALLVLGALASQKPQSDAVDRDGLAAELVGREARARADGQLGYWLHALGNTGNPNTLPAIERYLGDQDVALRSAAVDALRQVDSPQSTTDLLDRARSERDPRVRALAVEGLAQRPEPAGLDYVGSMLANERNTDVRRAAVAGLGRQVPGNEAAAALLRRTAQSDPSASVREQAARALAPR
jgi:HEAT repeat protein